MAKYYVRQDGRFLGPFGPGEVAEQLADGTLSGSAEAVEAAGQTESALRGEVGWVPAAWVAGSDPPASVRAQAARAMSRYRAQYAVAGEAATIAQVVKVLGAVLGCGALLLPIIAAAVAGAPLGLAVLVGLVLGGAIYLELYAVGVLVATAGQTLAASVDSAVHTSPFLTDDERKRAVDL